MAYIRKQVFMNFATVIIGIIAVASFITIHNLNTSFEWVQHTYEVVNQVNETKDDMFDCQGSVREAVFSGDKKYLSKYTDKNTLVEGDLDHLQYLTRDNKSQQENIYVLRENINRRMAMFQDAVILLNGGKNEDARQLLISKFGEPWVMSTRSFVEKVITEEKRLLDYRLKDYADRSNIVLIGIPIALVIYVFGFQVSSRLFLPA